MFKLALISALAVGTAVLAAGQQPAVELKVGDRAPEFTLPGTDGKVHRLSDYAGRTVVLAWYPAAFTGGCTLECRAFRDSGAVIKSFDVAYFMASVDDAETNKKFAEQEEADFPMLSDPEKAVATAYGVLNARGRANRWTFYIGPDGRLLYIDRNVTPATAGQDLANRLAELGVKKRG
jgi:peroxiredoxin Q/BCP